MKLFKLPKEAFDLFFEDYQTYQKQAIFPYLKDERLKDYFLSATFRDHFKDFFQEDTFQEEPLEIFCLHENKQKIGFIVCRFFPCRQYTGWIYDLFLLPAFQHSGKGQLGLALLEEYFFQKGAEKIQCTCLPPWSQRFFQSNGYKSQGNSLQGYTVFEKNTNDI